MQSFLRATYVALVSVSLISMAACSKVDFGHSGKTSKRSEERAGGQNSTDCLKLGNPDAGKDGGGKDGTDVVVVPGKDGGADASDGKGEEPNPPAKDGDDDYTPCQNPGQNPGQTDGNYPGQTDG